MASFTRQIPPGGEGSISVKLSTKGYGGRNVKHVVKVYTNDEERPISDLTLTGEVKKFAEINPQRVMLNGEVGAPLKATVTVSPASKGLFKITGARADQGKDIRITLTDPEEKDGEVYTLVVENQRGTVGRYQDTIRLATTSALQPEIQIPVWGNITAPQIATIQPRHLALSGPAGTAAKATVRIEPKHDNAFSITEVKAQSGANIRWDLKETEESGKKIYMLTVENLKKEKGRYYDTLFLKTDHKDMPEIRVSVSGLITD